VSRTPRASLLLAASLTLGLLAACGDDGADDVAAADDPAVSTTAPGNGLGIEGGSAGPEAIEVTGALDEKPTIALNDAGAVTELFTEDLTPGDGAVAGSTDEVEVQYVGQQLDGVEFDSSWDRGSTATFGLDGVIPGFSEGIAGMAVGGRRLLVIPEELAYAGSEPAGTLVFVVDLVAITQDNPDPIDPVGDGSGIVGVTGTIEERPVIALNSLAPATELVSQDLIEGDGAEAVATSTITVNYVGLLLDGTVFDETWDDGQTATFPLDGVITGWEQGLTGVKAGGRRLLVIPPDLAYGSAGNGPIGPDATLVFVVDVLEVS
jgi:peptidylprolyl isomerase